MIERVPEYPEEKGIEAHGKGLDLIMGRIDTDYLFIMHTDTFIYDAGIFHRMLAYCMIDRNIATVGCLEQLNRGYLRRAWRVTSRIAKYYSRKTRLYLGFNARHPRPYIEEYTKSFFALWNIELIKKYGYSFSMSSRIPGYELQDRMKLDGYKIKLMSPVELFRCLDHVEAGTVGLVEGYNKTAISGFPNRGIAIVA